MALPSAGHLIQRGGRPNGAVMNGYASRRTGDRRTVADRGRTTIKSLSRSISATEIRMRPWNATRVPTVSVSPLTFFPPSALPAHGLTSASRSHTRR